MLILLLVVRVLVLRVLFQLLVLQGIVVVLVVVFLDVLGSGLVLRWVLGRRSLWMLVLFLWFLLKVLGLIRGRCYSRRAYGSSGEVWCCRWVASGRIGIDFR